MDAFAVVMMVVRIPAIGRAVMAARAWIEGLADVGGVGMGADRIVVVLKGWTRAAGPG